MYTLSTNPILLTLFHLHLITAQSTETLGLIQETRKVTVSSSLVHQQVGVLVPVTHTMEDYQTILDKINTTVQGILDIPAIQSGTQYYSSFEDAILEVINIQIAIPAILKNILKHKQAGVPLSTVPACTIPWKNYNPSELNDVYVKITIFSTPVTKDATVDKYKADPNLYYEAHDALEKIKETLDDYYYIISDRATLLDNLLNKKVHSEVIKGIETRGCITPGNYEEISVSNCLVYSAGIFCTIDTKIPGKQQVYTLYSPIVYNNFRVSTVYNDNFLVKTEQDKWAVLQCELDKDDTLDVFDICDIIPYNNECSKAFATKDFNLYYNNCNFTRTTDIEDIDTELGYLVQKRYDTVKLTTSVNTETVEIVRKDPPYLIQTSKTIEFKKGEKLHIIKPKSKIHDEKVIYPWLTEANVNSLERMLDTEEILENIDYGLYVDIALIVIMSIIVPSVGFLVKMYVQYGPNKSPEYLSHKYKTSQNLKDNRKLTNIVR